MKMKRNKKSRRTRRYLRLFALLLLLFTAQGGNVVFYRSRILLPFTLHFSESYLLLAPGDSFPLEINGMLLQTEFASSRSMVASVTQNGIVRAWKPGKTIITATIQNRNGKKISCMVQVAQLNRTELTLAEGKSARLFLRGLGLLPLDIRWKSRDTDVASVSLFGRVLAVAAGTTVVTATVRGKTFACTVTVIPD